MANLDVALSMYSKNGKEQVMSFISERYAIFVSVSDCFRFLPTPKTSIFSSITELTTKILGPGSLFRHNATGFSLLPKAFLQKRVQLHISPVCSGDVSNKISRNVVKLVFGIVLKFTDIL